jgi:uncharacterized protein YbjT (DUF2867 family)
MILVTGSTGNVGSEVLKQVVATGAKVRAAYQSADKAAGAPAGVETAVLDFAKPETLAPALRGVEKVFLVAPSFPNMPELEGNVATEAKKAGAGIVKLSVIGAASKGFTFADLHRQSEEKIEASGVSYTFLRCNGFFQNTVNYNGGTIRTQNAFYSCMQDARVSHVDLRDIGAVATKVLTSAGHEGRAYDVTGPEALSNADQAEILSRVLGRKISSVDLSPADLKKALVGVGTPEWYAEATIDLFRWYKTGGASVISNDVEKVTGCKPGMFETYVQEFAGVLSSQAA